MEIMSVLMNGMSEKCRYVGVNKRYVGGTEKLYTGYRTRFVGVGRMKVRDEFFCMFEFGGGKP